MSMSRSVSEIVSKCFVNYIFDSLLSLGYTSENSSFHALLRPKFTPQVQESTLQIIYSNNILDERIERRYSTKIL
jgi:hypothetical protein